MCNAGVCLCAVCVVQVCVCACVVTTHTPVLHCSAGVCVVVCTCVYFLWSPLPNTKSKVVWPLRLLCPVAIVDQETLFTAPVYQAI